MELLYTNFYIFHKVRIKVDIPEIQNYLKRLSTQILPD